MNKEENKKKEVNNSEFLNKDGFVKYDGKEIFVAFDAMRDVYKVFLNSLLLLNGTSAVALMAFVGVIFSKEKIIDCSSLIYSLLSFAIGVALAVIGFFLWARFILQIYSKPNHIITKLSGQGIFSYGLLSFLCFGYGIYNSFSFFINAIDTVK
ncbi:hypothetical protein AAEX28_07155 [Lentisphaerota bacterium WC36G]|nr:hypothetical protein LJT99_10020 [Lentisphaerae bacterium WC36]